MSSPQLQPSLTCASSCLRVGVAVRARAVATQGIAQCGWWVVVAARCYFTHGAGCDVAGIDVCGKQGPRNDIAGLASCGIRIGIMRHQDRHHIHTHVRILGI